MNLGPLILKISILAIKTLKKKTDLNTKQQSH